MIWRTLTRVGGIAAIAVLIVTGLLHAVPTFARLGALGHGGGSLIVKFLSAIFLIIVVGKIGGWVATRSRQPRVVGEMLVGIALGPSLLGKLAPAAEGWLFPRELLPHLQFFAQLTVIAFMFMFGAGLSLEHLRGAGPRVSVLGIGMVAVPVLLGILLASGLSAEYRPAGVRPISFLLFVGVAMGVTALPVLVRILGERGLTNTRIGTMGLTAAGIDDAIAWCLLAIAVGTVRNDSLLGAARTVLLLIVYAVAVWALIRPTLRWLLTSASNHPAARSFASYVLVVLTAVCGAFVTDWIGVHAIFGAFLIGMAMPREHALVTKLTQATDRGVALVLPLFFAVVGLSVQMDLLSDGQDLLVCALVFAVAVMSKLGATTLIARLTRLSWKDSVAFGVMVNCRGLTGLVVLSTGLSLGIIGPNLFAMFAIMTLLTTIMTGPLLGRLRLASGDSGRVDAPSTRPGELARSASAAG